jgi:hypothetical protein
MNLLMKILGWLKVNYVQFIIYLTIFIFAIFKIATYYSDKSLVLRDFKLTEGKITGYKVFGVGPNRYLTYEYEVNSKSYKREINEPKRKYDECFKDPTLCENKRFIVIYSTKSPEKSLIDLTREIQGTKNPELPKSLKNFQ